MKDLNIYLCVVLVAAGIALHFLTKLSELEQQGIIIPPWKYWSAHPYTSTTVILSAYLFMAWQYSAHELTYVSAILTGIACNSLGDKMRAAASAQADKDAGVITRQVKFVDPDAPPK